MLVSLKVNSCRSSFHVCAKVLYKRTVAYLSIDNLADEDKRKVHIISCSWKNHACFWCCSHAEEEKTVTNWALCVVRPVTCVTFHVIKPTTLKTSPLWQQSHLTQVKGEPASCSVDSRTKQGTVYMKYFYPLWIFFSWPVKCTKLIKQNVLLMSILTNNILTFKQHHA